MSWKLVERCVEQCAIIAEKVPQIRWCPAGMGDPFLYPRLFEVITLMKAEVPNIHMRINTNCLALNDKMIEEILSSDLDQFTASLNFWDAEDYKRMQHRDAFEEVRGNIEKLLRGRKNDKLKITVQLLDIPMNRGAWEDFHEHWGRLGADEILLRSFIPMPYPSRNALSDKTRCVYDQYFGQEDWKLQCPRVSCPVITNTCCINKDGYVFPCCYGLRCLPESDICLGSIENEPLADFYLQNIKRLRLLHQWGKWDLIDDCRDCTYWIAM